MKKEKISKPKASKQEMTMTNMMRGPWIVPHEIRPEFSDVDLHSGQGKALAKSKNPDVVAPGACTTVNKSAFDRYYKGSEAFKYLVDKKLLLCKKKIVINEYELGRIEKSEVPKDLKSNADKETIELNSNKIDINKLTSVQATRG